MIRRLLLSLGFLLLCACASQAPLPEHSPQLALPMQLHILREQAEQRQDWLLVIQQESGGLRWSLMDPLGIPVARQRLVDGTWQADGLLPPNPQARELFAALLFALTPAAQLRSNYPAARINAGQRDLGSRWHVEYRLPLVFDVRMDQGVAYHVSPLNEEANP
ncbi:DUF3261 domain-containing protein [Pseudomonas sp. MH10]|uniref:DUF3261 domain-containing protein n=1 Tax=Pseudomonas sp. MH10 TaxID=3048627 RepID=UPI002AC9420E|nr:DUF3261 domain-containing protein [Pseudomonas sp. MH10]MEB0040208.1 DUF3261 domain-containing protein [Pseudomonas sp. MH10]WPX62174.1 DUF3261 domain-containing protein [Pseudomonas sp. MH10]